MAKEGIAVNKYVVKLYPEGPAHYTRLARLPVSTSFGSNNGKD